MNVHYTLKANGGTIMVPADDATKLRMELASQNLPSAGVGYEIFDKSDAFGTTAFVQNINRLRALEGELTRSIETLDNIDSARVHLVIPQRQIFSRNSEPPTASVVLKLRNSLNHDQVVAIQHLVAAAVAGLKPGRVAVVDDQGDLLAGGDGSDSADADSAAQDQQTTDYEERMRKRIENIVASVVGQGHVRVQVAADVKYNHVQQTSETFDPDSKVVRSTQTIDSSSSDTSNNKSNAVSVASALPAGTQNTSGGSGGNSGDKSSNSHNEETTNYEISKTVRTSTQDGGQVKRLSVAVVVDGTVKTLPNGKTQYTPRSKAEMAQIQNLVESAIGYDKARGDKVEVVNMAFARMDVGSFAPVPKPLLGLDSAYWFKIIEAGILSLTALLIGLFVVRPLIRNMFAPIPGVGGTAQIAGPQQQGAGQLPAPGGDAARRTRPDRRRRQSGRPARTGGRLHDRHPAHRRTGARILDQESRRGRRLASRRSAGDPAHLAPSTGVRTNAPAYKNRSERRHQQAHGPGALGRADARPWRGSRPAALVADGRGRDQGSHAADVQSGHHQLVRGRKGSGRIRLADVGHRLADGLL